MIRGTTAQFKFKLPYEVSEISWVIIKFWQPENTNPFLPITKELKHCVFSSDPKELRVSLTADETLRFSEERKAKVQIKGKHLFSDTVFGSRQQLISVYPMNEEPSTEDPTLPPVDDPSLPPENEYGWIIFDGKTVNE